MYSSALGRFKISRKIVLFGFALFSFFCGLSLSALPGHAEPKQCDLAKELVEKFIKLDARLGRISLKANALFDPMINRIEREEPGWDMAIVIREYKVLGCRKEVKGLNVEVEYTVLGRHEPSATGQCEIFTSHPSVEKVMFQVIEQNGELKIDYPPQPHLSVQRTIQLLQEGRKSCPQKAADSIRRLRAMDLLIF